MGTTDDITERLKAAASAVEAADLASDLRPIGFLRALDALGLPPTERELGGPATPSPVEGLEDEVSSKQSGDPDSKLLTGIARAFRLDTGVANQIYDATNGELRLDIGPAMLPDQTKAAAMRDVALLMAAGRQAAGLGDFTPLKVIREECDALGVLDSGNFSTEVGRLGFRVQGAGASREIKANRRHHEAAAGLIRRILETGS